MTRRILGLSEALIFRVWSMGVFAGGFGNLGGSWCFFDGAIVVDFEVKTGSFMEAFSSLKTCHIFEVYF
jgi:hypothetical protein